MVPWCDAPQGLKNIPHLILEKRRRQGTHSENHLTTYCKGFHAVLMGKCKTETSTASVLHPKWSSHQHPWASHSGAGLYWSSPRCPESAPDCPLLSLCILLFIMPLISLYADNLIGSFHMSQIHRYIKIGI